MEDKRTMTLNLSAREMEAVERLAAQQELSKTALIRQALRLYDLVNARIRAGETMSFSGDKERIAMFIGPGWDAALLSPATSPGEGSSSANRAARIASDHTASETLRKSEKPVNTEPTGQWRHYSSMPKDGRWFYARTAEGQERLVHYADKYDRLPICDQGVVWSTYPIEWCEAAPSRDDAGGGG